MLDVFSSLGATFGLIWQLIKSGGWIPFAIFFLWGARVIFLNWRQNLYFAKQKFILLAVDIPKEAEQTPKAVEQIFNALWASRSSINKVDKWWRGMFHLAFSFEIVSIEGYIQFLIHTPEHFRDIVEAAIYSQYPDSEIIQVEDYTQNVPKEWPAEGWDLWGTEFALTKNDAFPIRTYEEFEHSMSQQFLDPLVTLLEAMGRLGPGEQAWVQIVITPADDGWKNAGEKVVKQLIGAKVPQKKNILQRLFGPIFDQIIDILYQGLGSSFGPAGGSSDSGSNDPPTLMLHLSPGERTVVEQVQKKLSKIGYQSKMRFIYIGKKESFSKARGVAGPMGGFRQFTSLSSNSPKPHSRTITAANYFMVKKRIEIRQKKILSAFRGRSQGLGGGSGVMFNSEELASLWHFPGMSIRAPRVKRSGNKMVEPPTELPTDRVFKEITSSPVVSLEATETPSSLPVEPTAPEPISIEEAPEASVPQAPHISVEGMPNVMPAPQPQPAPPLPSSMPSSAPPQPRGSTSAPPDNLPMG